MIGDRWGVNLSETMRSYPCEVGDRFTTAAGRELGRIVSVDPGKKLTGAPSWAPADHDLIHQCRILTRALFTAWRWRHDDQLPHGHYWRMEGLNQVRAALDRHGPDGA